MRPISELHVGDRVKVFWVTGDKWQDKPATLVAFDHQYAVVASEWFIGEHRIPWGNPLCYIASMADDRQYGPGSSEVLEVMVPELE